MNVRIRSISQAISKALHVLGRRRNVLIGSIALTLLYFFCFYYLLVIDQTVYYLSTYRSDSPVETYPDCPSKFLETVFVPALHLDKVLRPSKWQWELYRKRRVLLEDPELDDQPFQNPQQESIPRESLPYRIEWVRQER